MARVRKGPTVIKQPACFACGHWQGGKSAFQDRPIAYRLVECIGGRRPKGDRTTPVGFRVVRVVYVDELTDRELLDDIKLLVTRLADRLGVMPEPVVKQVIHEVVRERIPAAFKARAARWQKAAEKWARHEANKGKRRGREFTVRGRRTHDAGNIRESWDGTEFVTRGRRVVDEGNSTEKW